MCSRAAGGAVSASPFQQHIRQFFAFSLHSFFFLRALFVLLLLWWSALHRPFVLRPPLVALLLRCAPVLTCLPVSCAFVRERRHPHSVIHSLTRSLLCALYFPRFELAFRLCPPLSFSLFAYALRSGESPLRQHFVVLWLPLPLPFPFLSLVCVCGWLSLVGP